MSTSPKVSVIIPVYNTEKYLRQCLDSVVNQTLRDIEIICIDDGSSDLSRTIIESYSAKDVRFKTIYFNSRKSALVARKKGVELATGEYIMFMDADDYLHLQACQKLYEKISQLDVDILHFSSEILNCSHAPKSRIQLNRELLKPYEHHLHGKQIFEYCFSKHKFGFTLWNKVFSKDLCKRAFASMEECYMPKAQDMYAFFIIAYYANSYFGWDSDKYYFYCFGRGVTGKNIVDIDTFERYCMQSKVIDALKRFTSFEKCSVDYDETIDAYRAQWMSECIELWMHKISESDGGTCLDILFHCWGKDVIANTAKKYWYSRDLVAKKAIGYRTDLLKEKQVKTIAFYYYHLTIGGIQRVISLLIPLFRQMGYNIILITDADPSENDIIVSEDIVRVTVHSYLKTDSKNYGLRIDSWENILQTYSIDVVLYNAWTSPMMLWDMLVLKISNIPIIVQTHSVFSYSLISFNRDFVVLPRIMALADGIVTLSEMDKTFWSHFNDRVTVIPNPVDSRLASVNKSKGEEDIIIWIGRFSNEKRPWEALEIAEKVCSFNPNAQLLMVGDSVDPSFLEKCKSSAEKKGLSQNIKFLGFQQNVYELLEKSKVLLMTSTYEGYSMVLLEAQAHGVPSVIYELPYIELAKEEKGVVSVGQNDRESAAHEIVHLLEDESYWKEKSDAAYNSFKRCVNYDYMSAWNNVLNAVWPNSSCSLSSRVMMDTILEHYALGWKKTYQALHDDSREPYCNSRVGSFAIWLIQKTVGCIRCYQEHGMKYTWNRVKYHLSSLFRRKSI